MPTQPSCSPYQTTGKLVYFARMLEKIRLHAAGRLDPAYHEQLGRGFDGRCTAFLHLDYAVLRDRVLAGGTDEQLLDWAFQNGRRPTDEEIEIWNDFMRKRGWRDESHERIVFRLKEAGLERLAPQAVTMFDFIDLDEGRIPPDYRHWEPPSRETSS